MRAIVADDSAPGRIRLADVPEPVPAPHEALVRLRAASVNPGDLGEADKAPAGLVLGWEAAGVVEREAADGSGPARGTRVTTFSASGGWAELRAAPTEWLAPVPDGVDLADAATLPVAAGSALRAVREIGPVLGRRLLVTGATGAVGAYAVQLGAMAGAEVVAVARDLGQADRLRGLGASEVVDRPSATSSRVDGVIDNVGGDVLVDAFGMLHDNGVLVSVGRAARHDVVMGPDLLLSDWGRMRRDIRTFLLLHEDRRLDRDLAVLARWVGEGRLRAQVDRVEDLDAGVELLAGRAWRGKLVLRIV
jgi:NADPH:quinone reductase